jgi:hypothetical protein
VRDRCGELGPISLASTTRVHVNQHTIRANRKSGERSAPLTVKTSKTNTLASAVRIVDESRRVVATVVYRPDKPLACGAHVWIETTLDVQAE